MFKHTLTSSSWVRTHSGPELAPGYVHRNSVVQCTQRMVKKGACGLLLGTPRAVDPHPGTVGRPAGHSRAAEGKRLLVPAPN